MVRIISHYDADGICAGAILVDAALRSGLTFHATCQRNLGDDEVAALMQRT